MSWQDLKDFFRDAGMFQVDKIGLDLNGMLGSIVRADILEGYDGRSKGAGVVLFTSSEDAQRAIRKSHTPCHGSFLTLFR